MRRREFILGGAVALSLGAAAQQPDRPRRVGIIIAAGKRRQTLKFKEAGEPSIATYP